jgi:hypothetical protein
MVVVSLMIPRIGSHDTELFGSHAFRAMLDPHVLPPPGGEGFFPRCRGFLALTLVAMPVKEEGVWSTDSMVQTKCNKALQTCGSRLALR